MKVTLLGAKHVQGVSRKTGKPFSNTVANVSYPKDNVKGLEIESIWLDETKYPVDGFALGKSYSLDRDSRGYVIDFTLA